MVKTKLMGQWLMMWMCLFHQTCGKDQVDGVMVDDVDVDVSSNVW